MKNEKHILVVEDDTRIAGWLERYLRRAGFRVTLSTNGQDGLALALRLRPDLLILDLGLPKLDGVTLCKKLRESSDIPIIMLTAREAHADRVCGLESGADDYIVKPFDPDEVVARVRAVLRRAGGNDALVIRRGGLSLEVDSGRVWCEDREIALSYTQFQLLQVFMQRPNKIFSRDQLLDLVFEPTADLYDRAVDNQVARLRKAIGQTGDLPIQTVYGAGYKFVVAGA